MQLDMNLDASDTSLAPATGTLTVPPPTLPTAGQTATIGGTIYTFATTITPQSAANTVLIGADVQSTLANLAGAINASSTGGQLAGTTYGSATVANASVTATGSTATTLNLQALNPGAVGDSDATSTAWTAGSFGAADLTGGADALPATATFTVPPGVVPVAGNTFDICGTTYTFRGTVASLTAPDDVLIGGTVQSSLANLAAAINLTEVNGQGAGAIYGTGTGRNGLVTASNPTATSLTLQAINPGSAGNSYAPTTSWTGGVFEVGDLTGGRAGVPATATFTAPAGTLVPSAGQTVTIGGTTYTFVGAGGLAAADDVLIGSDVATTLANLFGAITQSTTLPQGENITYGPGTSANASVTAVLNPVTSTITLTAANSGAAGNSVATSTSWSGVSFTGGDLAGGVDAQTATGAYTVPVPLPTAGQTVTVGGTTYTFAGSVAALTAPDGVLIGPDITTTLANLASAINATPAGAGVTYATGTSANTSVTATGSTDSTLTLQAIQSGSVGNSIATATNWTGGSFGAGDLAGGTDAGTFSDTIMAYDSLGNSHVLSFNFTKASAGSWNYQITIPAADVGATGNPQVVATGTLQFGPDGNLITPSADVQGISVPGLADGAKTMSINWQLFSSPGNAVITQTAEASATSGKDQDGYSAGTLQSYAIDSSGVINGVLSNGQTVALDQIALATFPNYDGLTHIGSNDYQTSLASGAASVGVPGSGGRGTLDGGSLEQSNVDIATAFTMLIQAERGYEANAKAITTADDVMQASIALIQG
jgi:flagellar hook protein FlgE